MRLARVDLGEGWIDLGYGEPVVIQKILKKYMNPAMKEVPLPGGASLLNSQYQPPKGMDQFVEFLEKKYKAKVVITNGAKQGIAAVMYALHKMGHTSCLMHRPYWTSTPNLISGAGLQVQYIDEPNPTAKAFFITTPNNPDGKEVPQQDLKWLTEDAKTNGVKIIHDAAYYSPIYTESSDLMDVGDVSIYSFAKMYGLSGLRVGYVVCRDESFVQPVTEYVERHCSGVSTASQQVAMAVEKHFAENPAQLDAFQQECRAAIAKSRAELSALDPQVIELEVPTSNSMFGWGKIGPKFNAQAAKVNMIPGDGFGKPGYVRFNIAVDPDLIKAAVERLNSI